MNALVKVTFSAKIDFSAERVIKIEEIEHVKNIGSQTEEIVELYELGLSKIFDSIRLTRKQKELLTFQCLLLFTLHLCSQQHH